MERITRDKPGETGSKRLNNKEANKVQWERRDKETTG